MIAVLASKLDPEARVLIEAWAGAGAALLSAEDLSCPGWDFQPSQPTRGVAVVDGQRINVSDLRAVLTRRPAVLAEELAQVCADDRAYVAAEANAFLVAWLHALPCRVVNRPTPTSLCGPSWSQLEWRMAAVQAGLEWAEVGSVAKRHDVIVCGSRCLYARTAKQARGALALAKASQTDLLGVWFQGDQCCGASVAPPLEALEVRATLLNHLLEGL